MIDHQTELNLHQIAAQLDEYYSRRPQYFAQAIHLALRLYARASGNAGLLMALNDVAQRHSLAKLIGTSHPDQRALLTRAVLNLAEAADSDVGSALIDALQVAADVSPTAMEAWQLFEEEFAADPDEDAGIVLNLGDGEPPFNPPRQRPQPTEIENEVQP